MFIVVFIPKFIVDFENVFTLIFSYRTLLKANYFVEKIYSPKNGKPVSNKSRLVSLKPFIADKGIIRVGGRLKNANIPHNAKYQNDIAK